jgi:hypothetical protein
VSRIPDAVLEDIRARVRMDKVAESRGVRLVKRGQELHGLCPFHEDSSPSLRIHPTKNSWFCSPCNMGGDAFKFVALIRNLDIQRDFAAVAIELAAEVGVDVTGAPPAPAVKVSPRVVSTYFYTDTAGAVLGQKQRWEPGRDGASRKSFTWATPDGSSGKPASCRTLYRAHEVARAIQARRPVVVVEGEKCADALAALGFVATCNEDGAGKWLPEHTQLLVGARVVVLPDCDAPGTSHAQLVEQSLTGVAEVVRVAKLPGLKAKGDVVDWLSADNTAADLREIVESEVFDGLVARAHDALAAAGMGTPQAKRVRRRYFTDGPASELFSRVFPPTSWLVTGLLTDDAVFAVAGEPKTTKTWAALEMAMAVANGDRAFGEFAVESGARTVAAFLVEDSPRSTRNRLRALADSRGLDPEKASQRIHIHNRASLDLRDVEQVAELVASIWLMPEAPALVVLDPLRDLHGAEENASSEMAVVMHALRAMRSILNAAIVFVHHAGKAGPEQGKRRAGQRMRGSTVIHASIDGGLYLTDLTGNLETEWINKAQSEVKAARSAGFFTLTLEVEDNAQREAVGAKWSVLRGEQVKAKREADVVEKVATALRLLSGEGDATAFYGVEAIREAAGVEKKAVSDSLMTLAQAGEARKSISSRGRSAGWRSVQDLPNGNGIKQDSIESPISEGNRTDSPVLKGSPISSPISDITSEGDPVDSEETVIGGLVQDDPCDDLWGPKSKQ